MKKIKIKHAQIDDQTKATLAKNLQVAENRKMKNQTKQKPKPKKKKRIKHNTFTLVDACPQLAKLKDIS